MSTTGILFVTGATSGFGRAIAEIFASHQWKVIITGRRQERLDALKTELENKYKTSVLPLCFDVRDEMEVNNAVNSLPADWKNIDVLVNNAGLALGKEVLQEGDSMQWVTMIDTNIKGLLYVTKAVSPLLIERKKGTIINIGSIAGKESYTGGNVYSATKFAVDGLTKNMRLDFLPHHIRVSQIAPGAAETEFSLVRFSGDQSKADATYKGFMPLDARDIAEAAWFIATRPPHVCINDLVIMPTAQANATTFNRNSN
ncbi:MAG: SDR family NAD(P)-dependent oxidoreductase [Flavobacteriales bacterium]|nr:SDR family NAD(P)-dependent oxidoreductase [Flavobacteriales bacterium]